MHAEGEEADGGVQGDVLRMADAEGGLQGQRLLQSVSPSTPQRLLVSPVSSAVMFVSSHPFCSQTLGHMIQP